MLQGKPNRIKSNAVPSTFLILALILLYIEMSKGQIRCQETSVIKWKSKKTNNVIGCTPCQPCPESQEYSIPCGSTVYVGTPANCVSCPSGKYSDDFNIRPCVSCTVCSNRIVTQNCTLSRNSVCGKCKPGYYDDNTSFGCMECAKCCHDGQDETHASCTAANQCKSRPYGCPSTYGSNVPTVLPAFTSKDSSSLDNHTALSVSSIANQHTKKTGFISQKSKSIVNGSSGQSIGGVVEGLSTVNKQKHVGESSTRPIHVNGVGTTHPLIIVLIVLLTVIVIILLIAITVVFLKKGNKEKKSFNINRNKDVESSEYKPVSPAHYDTPMEDDQTLEEFIQQNYKIVDKLCKVLNNKKEGIWDFERVAMEWKIEKEDVNSIKTDIHVEGGSPLRKLLDVLCSQRLCITVKQLANSMKSINLEAFKILEPHFSNPKERRES